MRNGTDAQTSAPPLTIKDKELSIMADSSLAQIMRLSQQLTFQFNEVNHRVSKAWLELELARETLRNLLITYDEWLKEKGLNQE